MSQPALVDIRLAGDEALFAAINQIAVPWLDALLVSASSRLVGLTSVVLLALWLAVALRQRALWPLIQLGAATGLTDLLGAQVLKPFVGRMRPCFALSPANVRLLVEVANVGSMPSLHSANAFAAATVVTVALPRAGAVAFPLALLIAVSRIGVGVHWPTDVLAGALYGSGVGALMVLAHRALARRFAWARWTLSEKVPR